jgi:hypothetical protein
MIGTSQGVIMSILVIYYVLESDSQYLVRDFTCRRRIPLYQNTYSIPLHDKNIIVARLLTLFFYL